MCLYILCLDENICTLIFENGGIETLLISLNNPNIERKLKSCETLINVLHCIFILY